jgi:hypothetical protein
MSSGGGIKHDSGKPPMSMVSADLMRELALVRAFGAQKYSRDNWKNGFKYTRSLDACLRHVFAFLDGEDTDSESGRPHLAHAIACLEHALNDYLHHPENDDRFKK